MKKALSILTLLSIAFAGSLFTSCGCCTGEEAAPPLRAAPTFEPLGSGGEVYYAK